MKIKETVAVVAAYNEEKYIGDVLKKIKRRIGSIIVVDDGSKDNTSKIAEENGAIVLRHVINLGKGAAIRTGCDYALKEGAKEIILIDADGQHDPEEIQNFLKALKDKDIVFGYREFDSNMPFVFKFGNWVIRFTTKVLYGIKLKDTQSGYRAFKAETYKKVRWSVSDYSMESEMIANLGKTKLTYTEIPIKTIYSDRYKGTTVVDGFKIVFNMFIWRLQK